MLQVKTPEEVLEMIQQEFAPVAQTEMVSLSEAVGRVLAEDIAATEYVPRWVIVRGVAVGHNLVTKLPPPFAVDINSSSSSRIVFLNLMSSLLIMESLETSL